MEEKLKNNDLLECHSMILEDGITMKYTIMHLNVNEGCKPIFYLYLIHGLGSNTEWCSHVIDNKEFMEDKLPDNVVVVMPHMFTGEIDNKEYLMQKFSKERIQQLIKKIEGTDALESISAFKNRSIAGISMGALVPFSSEFHFEKKCSKELRPLFYSLASISPSTHLFSYANWMASDQNIIYLDRKLRVFISCGTNDQWHGFCKKIYGSAFLNRGFKVFDQDFNTSGGHDWIYFIEQFKKFISTPIFAID